jgi:hypothetical protein
MNHRYFNKFKYRVRNRIQETLKQKNLAAHIQIVRKANATILMGKHNIDEYTYNHQGYQVFLPQFTMNYSTDPNEKFVVEVSTASMNMCELLQLINSLSSTPSCLVNLHYFSIDVCHP